MKLWQQLKTLWTMSKSGSLSAQWLKGEYSGGRGAQLSSGFEQSSCVYAAVTAVASNVAQIPFRIYRGDYQDQNVITSGPAVDLFERPHQFIDKFFFWELLATWMQLRGEGFIVALDKAGAVLPIARLPRGAKVASLLVISPDRMVHIIEDQTLAGWQYTGGNFNEPPLASQILLPHEVLQIRLPNPFLFWRGMSPLSVALLAAQTDYASAQFMKGLMLNNADTGVIVTTDQQPTEEQRQAIMAALKERKRQAGTADRPLLLFGGMKVEKPTVTSADMQFLENRKLSRQEISSIFHVPQTVMGFTEDANRAVAIQERLSFIEQTILPICRRLESMVAPIVRAFDPNFTGCFHSDSLPIMQEARRGRGDAALKFFGMGVPLNDINRVFDLGLPQYPWGDTGYLPFSVQPAGTSEPAPTPAPEEEDPADKALRLLRNLHPPPQSPPSHVCAGNPGYEASIAGSIKNKKGKLGKFFFEQRNRVLEKLKTITLSAQTKSIDDLFDMTGENEALTKRMRPLLIADLEFGGSQLFQELDLGTFNVPPSDAITFLNSRANKIKDINATTWDALKSSVQEGLQAGEAMDEIVDRVKTVYQTATDARAQTIAVTETNTAVNSGRMVAMVQAKVDKKSWNTAKLDNVRPSHQQAGITYAEGIPLDQPFVVGGYELMHPGDPDGPPEEVINCRCFVTAKVSDKAANKPLLKWEEWTGRQKP